MRAPLPQTRSPSGARYADTPHRAATIAYLVTSPDLHLNTGSAQFAICGN
jgi:hypothetical protein